MPFLDELLDMETTKRLHVGIHPVAYLAQFSHSLIRSIDSIGTFGGDRPGSRGLTCV